MSSPHPPGVDFRIDSDLTELTEIVLKPWTTKLKVATAKVTTHLIVQFVLFDLLACPSVVASYRLSSLREKKLRGGGRCSPEKSLNWMMRNYDTKGVCESRSSPLPSPSSPFHRLHVRPWPT